MFAAFRLYQFLPAGAAFAALGLICALAAVIAVAQNAMPMAFIGFAGGFAAPILVSTGQGNHVGLFSYYLLLGVAIAGLAWAKAWRPLNLLGFFATFGVATLWGVLKYRPEHFDTTEPFLIAFFLVYLAASLLYALRHSLEPKQAVDATLIFGTPIVAFSLQAALVRDLRIRHRLLVAGDGRLVPGAGLVDGAAHRAGVRCIAGWPNVLPPSAWASSRWPCRWHWTRAGHRQSGPSKARPCSGWAGARTAGWPAPPGWPCKASPPSLSWNRMPPAWPRNGHSPIPLS